MREPILIPNNIKSVYRILFRSFYWAIKITLVKDPEQKKKLVKRYKRFEMLTGYYLYKIAEASKTILEITKPN